MHRPPESSADPADRAARQSAMAAFARASEAELAEPIARHWSDIRVRDLKPVETGLIMLRGRIGGDGRLFNLGEATMSRAIVEMPDGRRGHGHVLGGDGRRARLAAIADALWQGEADRGIVEREIVAPVSARLTQAHALAGAEVAATKVEFFTLVRGED